MNIISDNVLFYLYYTPDSVNSALQDTREF